jgi:hypothetical protein
MGRMLEDLEDTARNRCATWPGISGDRRRASLRLHVGFRRRERSHHLSCGWVRNWSAKARENRIATMGSLIAATNRSATPVDRSDCRMRTRWNGLRRSSSSLPRVDDSIGLLRLWSRHSRCRRCMPDGSDHRSPAAHDRGRWSFPALPNFGCRWLPTSRLDSSRR